MAAPVVDQVYLDAVEKARGLLDGLLDPVSRLQFCSASLLAADLRSLRGTWDARPDP